MDDLLFPEVLMSDPGYSDKGMGHFSVNNCQIEEYPCRTRQGTHVQLLHPSPFNLDQYY